MKFIYILFLIYPLSLLQSNQDFIIYKKDNHLTYQDDYYRLHYDSRNKTCHLYKNSIEVPLIDKRYGIDKSYKAKTYRCSILQKERYRSCQAFSADKVSALFVGYGVYEDTGLTIGFREVYQRMDAELNVRCSKQNKLF